MSVAQVEQVPSERDWMLYQFRCVEQWTLRQTAEGFELSEPRVSQIVEQVAAYIASNVKAPSKEDEAHQQAVGKQLAADRIDHLYGQAMLSFRNSRAAKSGGETGKRSHGDARYLLAAARLALIASTLPPPRRAWPGTLAEEPARRGDKPVETCSAVVPEQADEPAAEASATDATAAAMMSCVETSRAGGAPKTKVARPVQQGSPNAAQDSRRAAFFQTS
jgi:hypothetical protein